MKISSVSKKVLASALSAAMVVAFAPTAAFGALAPTTKTITVNYAAGNGGTVADGKVLASEIVVIDKEDTAEATKDHLFVTPTKNSVYTAASDGTKEIKSDYTIDGWFIDANGNGLREGTEVGVSTAASQSIDLTAAGLEGASSITLTASYTRPAFKAADFDTNTLTFTANSDAVAGHTYKVDITNPDGVSLLSASNLNKTAVDGKDFKVIFGAAIDNDGDPKKGTNVNALDTFLVPGTYTATLSDNGKAVATEKVVIYKLTEKIGTATKAYFVKEGGNQALTTLGGDYTHYVDAEGNYAGGTTTTVKPVNKNMTFVAAKGAVNVTDVAYNELNRTFNFTLADPAITAFENGKDSWDVTVTSPSGATVFTAKYTAAGTVAGISFDQAIANHTTAAEEAGTYVVTAVFNDDSEATTYTSKVSMTLTKLVYVAGEGAKFAADAKTVRFTDGDGTQLGDVEASGLAPTVSAKTGYIAASKAWTLNGAKYNANTNAVKPGKENTWEVTYKAGTYAAAPTWSVAKSTVGTDNYYVLTVTAAAGTTVKVDGAAYTGPKQYTGDAAIAAGIAIVASDGTNLDKIINIVPADAALTTWKAQTTGASSYVSAAIGNDTAKWNSLSSIDSAIAAGTATLTADVDKILVDADDLTADKNAAAKALYEAVAAEATAQVAAYADGASVIAGDKVYTMTSTAYAAAAKRVADAEAKQAKLIAAATPGTAYNIYQTAIGEVITAANGALRTASASTLKPADIKAAGDVATELKAAKTAAEAEAALAKYAALTDAQKKLVATADVAAAEAVVAAAAVKDAQDDAAVSKTRDASKTVKAGANGKTTKKQSVTLKKITSKSGAKVTYKKSSGSSKVSVKSGKAYLAKGVKKGTYKATVKATCGTQTAKIKVTFKVK